MPTTTHHSDDNAVQATWTTLGDDCDGPLLTANLVVALDVPTAPPIPTSNCDIHMLCYVPVIAAYFMDARLAYTPSMSAGSNPVSFQSYPTSKSAVSPGSLAFFHVFCQYMLTRWYPYYGPPVVDHYLKRKHTQHTTS